MSQVVELTTMTQRSLFFWHRYRIGSVSYVFADDRDSAVAESNAEMAPGTRCASLADKADH